MAIDERRRVEYYRRQTGRPTLTARQRRRLEKKQSRMRARTSPGR